MAGRSKKRQASESPSRTVATKKARQTSASVSVRSERGSSNPSASRAKLVFRGHRDPYFPLRNKGATSLPTGDDYMFRIQVISTTTVVNADVFKKAVQGLVKICFPQDVLEEIGIEVVTQHMRNQDAPEPNIAKMTGVFRSEMIHRIVWMLAEYLDTPEKVEASVKAIMAASATLHGMKISEGVLDDVTSSLNNLRDQVPSGSTERLANSTDIEIPSFRIPDGDTTGSNNGGSMLEEDSIEDETMANIPGNDVEGNVGPPPSISKKHGRHKDPEKRFESAVKASANGNHTPTVAEPPASIRNSRNGKASKISTSWRWDIKDNMNIDEVSSHFRRTSDLFAYHALPIARRALGSHAKRKEIRQEMEKMLTNIPDDEFERWVESFVKLEAGDLTILERVSVDVECASHQVVSATAAPVDLRRSRDERTDTRSDVNDVTSHSQSEVKREVDADKQMVETISQERADADATKTVQGPAADTNSSSLQDNGHNRKHAPTPVVDIVWGSAPLDLSNVKQTVQKITDAISKRTSMKSTAIPHSDGTTTVQSLQDLQQKLIFILTDRRSKSHPFRKRTVCDQKLLPWALANIAAFPELQNQSLVFVNIMPYLSTVLELVCDPHVPLTPPNKSRVQADILVGLEQRGFNAHTLYGPNQEHLFQAIRSILGETLDDVKKLGFLEKYLRQLAFDHKPSFPELRNTPLVRACERESGSRW